MKKLRAITKRYFSRKAITISVVIGLAAAGTAYAAVNSYADLHAELGIRSGNASYVSDATASSEGAVKFGQASTVSCPIPEMLTVSAENKATYPGYPIGTKVYVPDGPDPWGGCFPGPETTGIPDGVTLTNWTGGCDIRTDNIVIEAKLMTGCDQFYINANNVTIKNSKIVGPNLWARTGNLIIMDSEADFGPDEQGQAMTGSNILAQRVNFYGGHRQVVCSNCVIEDSYFHDQNIGDNLTAHASAVRNDYYTTYRHNSIGCTIPTNEQGGGCSAPITGYPDFGPMHHNTMDKNLIWTGDAGYCVYGGDTGGKPYSDDPDNATYIQFTNNVIVRGNRPNQIQELPLQNDPNRYTCAYYSVVDAFNDEKVGYKFYDNMWDNGLLWRDDTGYPWAWGFPREVR